MTDTMAFNNDDNVKVSHENISSKRDGAKHARIYGTITPLIIVYYAEAAQQYKIQNKTI